MRIRSPGRSMVTLVLISLGPVVAPASTLAAEPGEADATAAAGTYVLADADSQGGDAVGKLTGDGQEISWSLGGAKVGKLDAARRAEGVLTGHTVTFSGVMREWVPQGMWTNAVLAAGIVIPGGKRREAVWKGELSGAAGLSHELPFDLALDIPANSSAFVTISVAKIGGVADTLRATFNLQPAPTAPTSGVVASPQPSRPQPGPTQQPTPSMSPVPPSMPPTKSWWTGMRAIESLVAVVSGLLTALGALLTASLSGFDVEDVLNALRDLIKGKRPADGDSNGPVKSNEAQQLADLGGALEKAAQQLKAGGKYVANGSLIDKVWYGVPHGGKEAVAWVGDVLKGVLDALPKGQSDAKGVALEQELLGTQILSDSPPQPRPDVDPNWGQCGEAAEWGARAMEGPIREIFGPDAVFTKIALQSNVNPLGNHIANKVIAPNGERYVVDMWATMVESKPKIYTEAEWLETWRNKVSIGNSITVTRGDLNSSQEFGFGSSHPKLWHGRGNQVVPP